VLSKDISYLGPKENVSFFSLSLSLSLYIYLYISTISTMITGHSSRRDNEAKSIHTLNLVSHNRL
jgi:hypothetical protein